MTEDRKGRGSTPRGGQERAGGRGGRRGGGDTAGRGAGRGVPRETAADRRRGGTGGRGDGPGRGERDRRRGSEPPQEQRGRAEQRGGGEQAGRSGQRGREEQRGQRGVDRRPRLPEPAIAEGVTGYELDRSVRQQLRTLSKENAEGVAQHLVMVGLLLAEDDLSGALAHAETAVRRAGRVAAAREALGLVAYRMRDWARALGEFRTARRLSGSSHLLPYMVDAERGLGRLERALDLAHSPEAGTLAEGDRVELAIVVSGIRRDLGQGDAAVAALRIPQLRPESHKPWAAALFYAYADALLFVQRPGEAREWFARAAAVDDEGRTDADDRVAELDGVVLTDLLEDHEDGLRRDRRGGSEGGQGGPEEVL